jgi:hypothetical protein
MHSPSGRAFDLALGAGARLHATTRKRHTQLVISPPRHGRVRREHGNNEQRASVSVICVERERCSALDSTFKPAAKPFLYPAMYEFLFCRPLPSAHTTSIPQTHNLISPPQPKRVRCLGKGDRKSVRARHNRRTSASEAARNRAAQAAHPASTAREAPASRSPPLALSLSPHCAVMTPLNS